MCKDGEGRSAIWDQKFDLKCNQSYKISFECRDGSPFESRLVGKTDEVNIANGVHKIVVKAVDDCQEGKKGEEIGYVQVSFEMQDKMDVSEDAP